MLAEQNELVSCFASCLFAFYSTFLVLKAEEATPPAPCGKAAAKLARDGSEISGVCSAPIKSASVRHKVSIRESF